MVRNTGGRVKECGRRRRRDASVVWVLKIVFSHRISVCDPIGEEPDSSSGSLLGRCSSRSVNKGLFGCRGTRVQETD